MAVLIFILVFASMFGYFATQNTTGVSIQVLQYTFSDVPLYLVVLSAMLGGVCASWFISIIGSLSASLAMHGKNQALKQTKLTVDQLTKKVHQLELENTELRTKSGEIGVAEENSM